MKFRFTGAVICVALSLAASAAIAHAQSTVWPPPSQPAANPVPESSSQSPAATSAQPLANPAQSPAEQPAAAPAAQPVPQGPVPQGKVLFSRSIDENGETVTHADSAAASPAAEPTAPPTATDAERQAITFTDLDLDVHLHSADAHIAVRAQLTIRNDGKTALDRIPLQISSSLHWDRIRLSGADSKFVVSTLNSDSDHTGQLHEAAISLASSLASGASAHLDVEYSGAIPQDAHRLLAIGTPEDAALHSDWDRIAPDFTGLRGFGNVIWYPVSSVPVILGDGARVFDEIGSHKLRIAGAHFRLRLADEFPAGQAPTVALVNGQQVALTVNAGSADDDVPGVATAETGATTLGFEAPSLFLAARTPHTSPQIDLYLQPESASATTAWTDAAASVEPFIESWLGRHANAKLTALELPDPQDAPFETGALLAAPVLPAPAAQLQGVVVHALAHAYLHDDAQSRPAWLEEGVASFLGLLWTERQENRDKALESLEASRPALALAEPESPGESVGHPLARAISPVYYRTKADYVLWMLRDIAGPEALSAALRAYGQPANASTAAPGTTPSAPVSFEKLIEESGTHRDLGWFFADWVDADHGLPDLSIESIFPKSESADSWLVTVNVANTGYAAAEVPVTVRSDKKFVTQRVRIPARGKVSERILVQGKPTEVQLNDGAVPETQASVHITTLDQAASASAGISGSLPQ